MKRAIAVGDQEAGPPIVPSTRKVDLRIAPQLLTDRLGSELYSPAEALQQIVANALDAGCSRVDINITENVLGAAIQAEVADDGVGISPDEIEAAFAVLGEHKTIRPHGRDIIGSKGIGRFSVFALAYRTTWTTVAEVDGNRVRQSWALAETPTGFDVETSDAPAEPTGTVVRLHLRERDGVQRLFAGVRSVHRALFNAFAGYLLRYRNEVTILVNGEVLDLAEFVESEVVEEIPEGDSPAGTLHHIILGARVDQQESNALVFASAGNTILRRPVDEAPIEGKKYLGLIDSAYLQELTNTAKSDLARFDERFRQLEHEALDRAKAYIQAARGDQALNFLRKARSNDAYPFKVPPQTPVQQYSQDVYDRLIVELDREFGIGAVSSRQLQLILALVSQLLKSEDLADVITDVLGLRGEEVTRFADVLKRTTLSSVIAVSELIVDRLGFLQELEELVYGAPAEHVLERRHLQKVIEAHTWIFGEQYHLMGADSRLSTILSGFVLDADEADPDAPIQVDAALRDVPDFYLAKRQWNEGAKYTQHLVVEIKRPSTRISTRHIDRQLERYASQIVENQVFGQRSESHRFTFIIVSAELAAGVRLRYQKDEEPGLINRPPLVHPTELWALRWSDLIDRRRGELAFLEQQVELSGDPKDLDYLRRTVGEHLPQAVREQAATETESPLASSAENADEGVSE